MSSYKALDKIIPKFRARNMTPRGYYPNPVRSQKRLNALWRNGVKAGENINPYGRAGNTFRGRYRLGNLDHISDRPHAMKRKRIQLKEKRKIALEMHELQQLARESASDAMMALIRIVKDPKSPHPSRIAAASVILDRGYGKSTQVAISANVTDGKADQITGDELDRRISKALKRVEDITRRAPQERKSPQRPADLRKYH